MFTLIAIIALSQCGPRGCPAPSRASVTLQAPQYAPSYAPPPPTWVPSFAAPTPAPVWTPDDAVIDAAVRRVATGMIRDAVERRFAIEREKAGALKPGCKCGDGCPCADKVIGQLDDVGKPGGVARDKLDEDTSKIRHVGPRGSKDVSVTDGIRLIEQGVPDDAHKRRITFIGTEGQRKAFTADWNSHNALAPYRGLYLVQCYAPDDWHRIEDGFKDSGLGVVYAQAPDGLVLHRQDGYAGPEQLAKALYRASEGYDPAKDPDLSKPPAPPAPPIPPKDGKKPAPTPTPDDKPADKSNLKTLLGLVAILGCVILIATKKKEG